MAGVMETPDGLTARNERIGVDFVKFLFYNGGGYLERGPACSIMEVCTWLPLIPNGKKGNRLTLQLWTWCELP
jgi:hypothetical protein